MLNILPFIFCWTQLIFKFIVYSISPSKCMYQEGMEFNEVPYVARKATWHMVGFLIYIQ